MNIEIFKRNIKLQELGIGKLSGKEQGILNFLNDNLSNLNSYTSDKYEDYLLFGKDIDNILLKYDEKNEDLYADYDEIWSVFELKFNIEYNEIQELIQWYVVDTPHLEVIHIPQKQKKYYKIVVDTIHLKVNHIPRVVLGL